jgi:hypothetical protein
MGLASECCIDIGLGSACFKYSVLSGVYILKCDEVYW